MVGGAGSTFRTVIEYHQLGVSLQNLVHLTIVRQYALRLVLACGNGEVHRQYRERIYQQLELLVKGLRHLLLRAVLRTEEARAVGDGRPVDFGSRADDSSRIELDFCRVFAYRKLTHLHILKFVVTLSGIVPFLQLAVEEPEQTAVAVAVVVMAVLQLACRNLQRAQAVLVEVVGVDLLDAQCMVAVATPSATEVQLGEDSSYAVAATESQSHGIVLAVACIREFYLPSQWGEEGAWCSESIDSQCVVGSILGCPLGMVNQARWQRVQVEVAHAVGTHDHRCFLAVECVNDSLQCLWRRVQVV